MNPFMHASTQKHEVEGLLFAGETAHKLLLEASQSYTRSMSAIVLRYHGAKHVPGFQELVDFGGDTVIGQPKARKGDKTKNYNDDDGDDDADRCAPPTYDIFAAAAAFELNTSVNLPEVSGERYSWNAFFHPFVH